MRKPIIALIHSPLVGPFTWSLVALVLRKQGWTVSLPMLSDRDDSAIPHYEQHAQQIIEALAKYPSTQPVLWVGHSGAGLRLPVYRHAISNPVAGYIFVDAGIPHHAPPSGLSQLEFMARDEADSDSDSDGDAAAELQYLLDQGERFPNWTEAMLSDEIPNPTLRAALMAELQPHGQRYFNEPLPVFADWPDARCGYIHFSSAYNRAADDARQMGWPVAHISGGHFHMIVNPMRVARAIVDLVEGQLTPRTHST